MALTQIPLAHVPPVQQSAVVVQVWPPRPQVAQTPAVHRQPAQHWLIPSPQAPPPWLQAEQLCVAQPTSMTRLFRLFSHTRQVASHSAISSPNQNQPPFDEQLFEPCSHSRPPPISTFTWSCGMEVEILNEHDDVVPPRGPRIVCVTQLPPESIGVPLSEVYCDLASVTPIATEFLVESASGGSCVIRVVTSSYGSGADWENEFFAQMIADTIPIFDNLATHLNKAA